MKALLLSLLALNLSVVLHLKRSSPVIRLLTHLRPKVKLPVGWEGAKYVGGQRGGVVKCCVGVTIKVVEFKAKSWNAFTWADMGRCFSMVVVASVAPIFAIEVFLR